MSRAEPPGPYPIVLAHGFSGFEHLTDLEALPYFFEVEETLESEGEVILTPEVAPFEDSRERGRQLIEKIEAFLAERSADRVHIIAHSQGGLDARYVAHERPELVESVVTIATPHGGTKIADIALQFIDHPGFRRVVDALGRLLGRVIYDDSGPNSSVIEALRQLSERGIETFNREITDRPGIRYVSIAGRTDQHLGADACRPPKAPEFIEQWQYDGDTTSPLFEVTESILNGPGSPGVPNDGLVRVSHTRWGRFLGCIPADHLDQVGQIAGDEPGPLNQWDHMDFFRNLIDWLHRRERRD